MSDAFTPSSPVVFTLPGKLGDNLARLPIAHRYAKERGQAVDMCVDEHTAPSLLPLLARLPWVSQAFAASGIVHDGCGGQPWDFGAPNWFAERYQEVYHLGYRRFPRWGNLTTESVPPNWPNDLSKDDLLSQRPLGFSWREPVWESCGRSISLSAKSSRPHADAATRATAEAAWPRLQPYSNKELGDYLHTLPLYDAARELTAEVLITTYSAMCQLATLVGAPCVVLIPKEGYGLGHYDSRTRWYPGWEIATEGDAEGLVQAVDRAIAAVTGDRDRSEAATRNDPIAAARQIQETGDAPAWLKAKMDAVGRRQEDDAG